MTGIEQKLSNLLRQANKAGDYRASLVCTEQGLLVAAAGDTTGMDDVAALAALFDEVLLRARAHLGMQGVDEVTVRDPRVGRLVIRPIGEAASTRMFLAVSVPPGRSWRRVTTTLCGELGRELSVLGAKESA